MINIAGIEIEDLTAILSEEMNKTYDIPDSPTEEEYNYIQNWSRNELEVEWSQGDILHLWRNTLKYYLQDGYSLGSALFDYFY